MRVLPGTQDNHLLKRSELMELDTNKFVLGVGIRPEQIDDSQAVNIELNAGDISIHNPSIIHGSNANTSEKWRVGLTLRYIPTSTWVNKEGHENILLRGEKTDGVANLYADRPRYAASEHMAFRGCEHWNDPSA